MLPERFTRRGILAAGAAGSVLGLAPGLTARPAEAAAADELRPFNNRFYGWPLVSDTIWNARWMEGKPLSVRLRADRSGTLTGLVWLLRLNQPEKKEGRYSAKDGGYVHIELRRCRSDAYPEQGWADLGPKGLLARTAPNNGRDIPLEAFLDDEGGTSWQHWPLDRNVEVRAGDILHALFVPHEEDAWGSINCYGQSSPAPLGSGLFGGPYFRDDWAIYRQTRDQVFKNLANPSGPTIAGMFLRYADGMLLGPPAFGAWNAARKPIGGEAMARQRFVINDYTRTVDGVWLRAWRAEDEAPEELVVELTQEGRTMERVSLPTAQLPQGPPNKASTPLPMLRVPFRQRQVLERGRTYELNLTAARRGIETTAMKQLTRFNGNDLGAIRDRFGPELAQAEFSRDSGASWQAWPVEKFEDEPRGDMTMPVAFTVVG